MNTMWNDADLKRHQVYLKDPSKIAALRLVRKRWNAKWLQTLFIDFWHARCLLPLASCPSPSTFHQLLTSVQNNNVEDDCSDSAKT